jgi:hypothetical protein
MMANEVLMEIFEYYDFYSLLFSFSSINARFDALLTGCHANIDLDRIAPNDFIRFMAQIIPQINNNYIQSIRSTNMHHMSILAHDDILFYFAHIRSLKLYNISGKIIRTISERVHFYRLEYVSIGQDSGIYYPESYPGPSSYFLDSNRYRWLRIYDDSYHHLFNFETTVLLSLEHIRVAAGSSGDIIDLLRRSPRLKSFEMQFWPEPYAYPSSSSFYTHNTLTNLHLKMGWEFHMPTIMYLFQSTPYVRKFTFTASKNSHYTVADPHWWESVLSKYFLKLRWLYLKVSSHKDDTLPNLEWPVDLEEYIVRQQIEASPYWRAHTWQLTYEKRTPTVEHSYHMAAFSVT